MIVCKVIYYGSITKTRDLQADVLASYIFNATRMLTLASKCKLPI